jgi:hypothetical protein
MVYIGNEFVHKNKTPHSIAFGVCIKVIECGVLFLCTSWLPIYTILYKYVHCMNNIKIDIWPLQWIMLDAELFLQPQFLPKL